MSPRKVINQASILISHFIKLLSRATCRPGKPSTVANICLTETVWAHDVARCTDTGKSTWLVLPKNCAENFFPSINDQESKKVVCQDTEGKDWNFTLRFSPKNEGRMHVLDEFYLYAQDMELSLGDTVTFSRLDPEGKLILGCRKNSSESPSNHLPRVAIPSTSRVRDTRGIVKFYNVNEANGKKIGYAFKVGLTSNSSRKKQKMSQVDTPNEAQEPLSSNHGGNGPFITVAERVKIKSQKEKAETSTHKKISKGKNSLPTVANICKGKAINSTRVPPIMVSFALPPIMVADKKRKISAFDPTLKEST
ncbi:B3 domain-containing protein [Tanacetum coccineum]